MPPYSDYMAETNKVENDADISDDTRYLPERFDQRVAFVKKELLRAIQPLCVASKKTNGNLDYTQEPQASQRSRTVRLLRSLDNEVIISPQLREQTNIGNGLRLLFNPDIHLPFHIAEASRSLFEKWEGQIWGSSIEARVPDTGHEGEDVSPQKRPRVSGSIPNNGEVDANVKLPPATHPILGINGIMHGVAMKRNKAGGRTYVKDPRYLRHNAKIFGHNHIEVGEWWPKQIIAFFNGAHGSHMAGISGSDTTGAYSIVVSGTYEDLDKDYGHILYYSGSGSHDNDDPHQPSPSTAGTLALKTSHRTQKPIRVLRAASSGGRFRPTVGIRYDGLYKVIGLNDGKTKTRGGLYEQFKLVREEGQPDLELVRQRPTAKEVREYDRIEEGFRT